MMNTDPWKTKNLAEESDSGSLATELQKILQIMKASLNWRSLSVLLAHNAEPHSTVHAQAV